ncbi:MULTISPECIES: N-acetylmannosamine-6-phosphate 2-epimerase [unclassified Candidatus Sulfotelmatobacter]|uniref:N-acetylmannosamine-6-phosphate 2-epimerase n=1 Tax=unclassified Candidatus Sulfotelmatobacter TaxID=2635724 RepID=UPI0016880159|nr:MULTISPECIES: N-acetylmannosamine-6-phosphate 2-epimerase [unclassified Candidatus Sulfotelmatobacter]MBD2763321.1 N-acetylmannosamine-6-phosphate 2-epimerase [Kocuria sp. cx-116]
MTYTQHQVIESLAGRLIVSTQAYPGEPMRDPRTMSQVAASAVRGGAAAVRVQGISDIHAVRSAVEMPVIGLWKDGDSGVYITPTYQHAYAVALAGAHVVAIDGTRRSRPDGLSLEETIARLHGETNALVMADCGSLDDALAASDAGADLVGTTLAGYTGERPKTDGPDLALLEAMRQADIGVPIIAEGRIHTPTQAAAAMGAGAHSVVVGTAITHPTTITSWFVNAVEG